MVKAGQQLGFVDKRAQAQGKTLGIRMRTQRHVHGLGAARQRGRHVLFDGHFTFKGMIKGQIHDAKAANPQQTEQLKFAQARARRQGAGRVGSKWRRV